VYTVLDAPVHQMIGCWYWHCCWAYNPPLFCHWIQAAVTWRIQGCCSFIFEQLFVDPAMCVGSGRMFPVNWIKVFPHKCGEKQVTAETLFQYSSSRCLITHLSSYSSVVHDEGYNDVIPFFPNMATYRNLVMLIHNCTKQSINFPSLRLRYSRSSWIHGLTIIAVVLMIPPSFNPDGTQHI
jgi:hypothetical protein